MLFLKVGAGNDEPAVTLSDLIGLAFFTKTQTGLGGLGCKGRVLYK
jgi:hypothetical protein